MRKLVLGGLLLLVSAALLLSVQLPVSRADGSPEWRSRTFVGEPTDEIRELARELEAIWDDSPEIITGTIYLSDYSGVELVVKKGLAKSAEELLQANELDDAAIKISEAPLSSKELRELQQEALRTFDANPVDVVGTEINVLNGQLVVALSADTYSAAIEGDSWVDLRRNAQSRGSEIPSFTGDENVRVTTGTEWTTTSARSDPLRFTMGSLMAYGTNTGGCSAGYPAVIKGKTGVLTAGHCAEIDYRNPGAGSPYVIGSTITHDTWRAHTQNLYGDFQLVISSNSSQIASDPNKVERYIHNSWDPTMGTETDKSLITNMDFSLSLTAGEQLCHSGYKTGRRCRYVAISVMDSRSVEGRTVWPVTRMMFDENLDGSPDCGGWRVGDSGGPVFHSNPTGVTGHGLVTSFLADSSCAKIGGESVGRLFTATEIWAVKSFDPSAIVGGFS